MNFKDIAEQAKQFAQTTNTSDYLRDHAKEGLELLNRIETMLRTLHRQGILEHTRTELLTKGSPEHAPLVRDALNPNLTLSPSCIGLQMQMKLIGDNVLDVALRQGNDHFVQNILQIQHQRASWAKWGLNTFNLTASLAAGLILTEPLPLTEENFALPFPTFCVVVPEGYLPFSFVQDRMTWAKLIWVHRFLHINGNPVYQITVDYNGTTLWWREPLDKLEKYSIDEQRFALEEDPTLTQSDAVTMTTALRLVRNLVAWINATGLPKESAPAGKRKKPAKHVPKDNFVPLTWFLGREVKVGPEIRKLAQEAVQNLDTRTPVKDWKVKIRHIVRGHWKQQFYGEGRMLRKPIFVEPYYRGPEGAAAFAHMYQPRDPNTEEK